MISLVYGNGSTMIIADCELPLRFIASIIPVCGIVRDLGAVMEQTGAYEWTEIEVHDGEEGLGYCHGCRRCEDHCIREAGCDYPGPGPSNPGRAHWISHGG